MYLARPTEDLGIDSIYPCYIDLYSSLHITTTKNKNTNYFDYICPIYILHCSFKSAWHDPGIGERAM